MKEENLATIIKSIEITNLFDIFNYNIKYKPTDRVLIITGPNGFGKTQVLNIIFNLFDRKFVFFRKLVFDKISICLSNEVRIEIIKEKILLENSKSQNLNIIESKKLQEINEQAILKFKFFENDVQIDDFDYSVNLSDMLLRNIERYLPVHRISEDQWVDHRTDNVLTIDELMNLYGNQLPQEIYKSAIKFDNPRVNEILDSINVHLIKEQRLFKKVQSTDRNFRNERDQTVMIETIQTYANELKQHIMEMSQRSFFISQNLDSTYPNRLISEKSTVSRLEYDKRFEELKLKQDKLTNNGLYERKQNVLSYSEDDAKALLVYLNDLEQKLSVFDDLLEKLELFTSILNERRFTFKSISIDREKGFYFKTLSGKILDLSDLSSGEQHEVVLLYELIFKTRKGLLVLIDEPEISLHITWQKEFLGDLLKIINIQEFQVLIATHSPSIINDRWDLVYNLEKR